MYSQFFVLSLRGDTLIFKDCKLHVAIIILQQLIYYYSLLVINAYLIANNCINQRLFE
jgi:hypothetical protein